MVPQVLPMLAATFSLSGLARRPAVPAQPTNLPFSAQLPVQFSCWVEVGAHEGNTRYDSFGDYIRERLPSVQDFIEPRYVRYNAADFPEGRGDG